MPPDGESWVGFYDGLEVAFVWPEGTRGNHIASWQWKLAECEEAGRVDGTDDETRDRLSAQKVAEQAYFGRS
ncbi:hypothetical protein ACQKKX_09710 [Neorhizobium sp. NPDC001467]|uniref:hypothetical protein n=1 Tax=Neorhizobium sp. NPDC001467 TaxID=3390595 RepID=UPI003D03FB20